ncbi:MAG: hypothetical protein ACTSR3_16570 [Candidatus Helarchaeota archaeon]
MGVTPEAKTEKIAFQSDKPEDTVGIDKESLKEIKEKYSTEWDNMATDIAIGDPQLSEPEVIEALKKLKGKQILISPF